MLDQTKIEELAAEKEITILCGHYEGVDQRVLDYWQMEEVSIGDYVLTGGELASNLHGFSQIFQINRDELPLSAGAPLQISTNRLICDCR